MLRIALRLGRGGFIAATLIAAFNGIAQSLGYDAIAGGTPQARAAFAAQVELLGRQLTFLLPIPTQVETLAGFLQWRHYGTLPLIYGTWAFLSAAGAARGDEERGQVEQWLAAGVSRARYVVSRSGAFLILATASVAVTGLATLGGAALAGEKLPLAGLVQQTAVLLALTLCCYAIAMLVAQLATTGRSAAGLSAAVLGSLFLIAGASRTGGLEAIAPLSPFWHFERSRPLIAGGGIDVSSLVWTVVLTIASLGVALSLFVARDHGASALRRRAGTGAARRHAATRPTLRLPVLAPLDRQLSGLAGWTLGLAALGSFLGSVLPTMIRVASEIPLVRLMVLRGSVSDLESAFVGNVWGSSALLVLSAFAVSQVAGWISDETEGRLEMTLSAPVARGRVVLERAAVLAIGSVVLVAVASLTLALATRSAGLNVDIVRFAGASALLVPLVVAIGAIGALLGALRPRATVWIVSTVVIASYFINQLAPMFDLPAAVRNLSLFELYGSPLVLGPNWTGLAIQVAVIVGGFGLAMLAMSRRDVTR